jgi:hypothetical protein
MPDEQQGTKQKVVEAGTAEFLVHLEEKRSIKVSGCFIISKYVLISK